MTAEQNGLGAELTDSPSERAWLDGAFANCGGGYPSLEQIWRLMDETWEAFGCNPEVMDERVSAFYAHPVWLLNGLFIEQHDLSLANRRVFTHWVAARAPRRVADFGGGFGTLARMIGAACPAAEVEVIEPHPHPAGIARSLATANVRYRPALTGYYDILIATDVFEHVLDPLALVADTACHLRPGGHYVIANCFWPVVRCHLPQTFHFRHTWECALGAMGLSPGETVCYGRAFARGGQINLDNGRMVERRSRWLFHLLERLPRRVRRVVITVLWSPPR